MPIRYDIVYHATREGLRTHGVNAGSVQAGVAEYDYHHRFDEHNFDFHRRDALGLRVGLGGGARPSDLCSEALKPQEIGTSSTHRRGGEPTHPRSWDRQLVF